MQDNIFNDEKFVKEYCEMLVGYNNSFVVNNFKKYVPENLKVLELGVGPGLDYDTLKDNYNITPSDTSNVFLEMFNKKYENKAIYLCAKDLDTTDIFDCIFSNKVLQVLNDQEMKESFINQYKILNNKGLLFHCIWIDEKNRNLDSNYTTVSKILNITKDLYDIIEIIHYSEMEENDSIIFIARKKV